MGKDSIYLTLMYGRRERRTPPGYYEVAGGRVLGPFTSVAAEFVTTITCAPGDTSFSLFDETGRFFSSECAIDVEDAVCLTQSVYGEGPVQFRRERRIGRLVMTKPDGEVVTLGEPLYYNSLYWGGFSLISSAVFSSDSSWREMQEEFDPAKAVPPLTK